MNEKAIAQKSERMLSQALQSQTQGFKRHASNAPSVKDAYARAKVKRYQNPQTKENHYYMRSLSVVLPKHGFVQHFGVDTVRSSAERTRHKPKTTTYTYRTHYFNLKAKQHLGFIDKAVTQSQVIGYLSSAITQARGEEIALNIKNQLQQINSK